MYCEPKDIVERLYRKRHWMHGDPSIRLRGKEGSFGTLSFDFGDETVKYRIYIGQGKYQDILNAAKMAVLNFQQYVYELLEEYADYRR